MCGRMRTVESSRAVAIMSDSTEERKKQTGSVGLARVDDTRLVSYRTRRRRMFADVGGRGTGRMEREPCCVVGFLGIGDGDVYVYV